MSVVGLDEEVVTVRWRTSSSSEEAFFIAGLCGLALSETELMAFVGKLVVELPPTTQLAVVSAVTEWSPPDTEEVPTVGLLPMYRAWDRIACTSPEVTG